MRITEILTERFNTIDTYKLVYSQVFEALRDIAPKIAKQYSEGEYYAGHVIDELSERLKQIVNDTIQDRVPHLFFNMVLTDKPYTGGRITKLGNGNTIFAIHLPRKWFSDTPNMFYYSVRDNGKKWTNAIASTFIHELVHLEQQVRRGENPPRGGNNGSKPFTPEEYLSSDEEIGAQAVHTALELIQWAGSAEEALQKIRRKHMIEELARSGMIPHLEQNYRHLRNNPSAWKHYLKTLVWNLNHYRG
jgi:hypothetical protein